MRNLDSFSKIIQGIQSFGRCRQQGMSVRMFKDNIAERVVYSGVGFDFGNIEPGKITETEYYTILNVLGIRNSDVFKPSIEVPKIKELMHAIDYISSKVPVDSIGTSEAEGKISKIIEAMQKKKVIRDSVANHLVAIYGIGMQDSWFSLDSWAQPRLRYFGGFKINGVKINESMQKPEMYDIIKNKDYKAVGDITGMYMGLCENCPEPKDNGKEFIPVAEPFVKEGVYIYIQVKSKDKVEWRVGCIRNGTVHFDDEYIKHESDIIQVRVGYGVGRDLGGTDRMLTDAARRNIKDGVIFESSTSINYFNIPKELKRDEFNLFQKCRQAVARIQMAASIQMSKSEGEATSHAVVEGLSDKEKTKVTLPFKAIPGFQERMLKGISENRGSVNSAKSALRGASIAIKNLDKNGSDEVVSTDSDILNKKRARGIVDDLKSVFS